MRTSLSNLGRGVMRSRAAAGAAAMALLLLGAMLPGCARDTATIPLTGIAVPVPKLNLPFLRIPFISLSVENDFSRLSWNEAFARTHEKLAEEYPFTEWKGIDWPALEARYAPMVAEAAEAREREAYYLALRSYVAEIGDGNLRLNVDARYRDNAIGGGHGFALTTLDDGRVIAHVLLEDGPAADAGMEWGAEILAWNGIPVQEAVAAVSTAWSEFPPSTAEHRRREQERLLVRAPAGTEAAVRFRNPGAAEPVDAVLTAVRDRYAALDATYPHLQRIGEFDAPITARTLESGLGYLRIHAQASTIAMPFPARAVRKAVEGFIADDVPGVILDVRGNSGGMEDFVPQFLQPFFGAPAFYKDVALYDVDEQAFVRAEGLRLEIPGASPHYDGPIVTLIDESTYNAGEGIPMALRQRDRVTMAGLSGTHGAFGIIGGEILLPGGATLYYPVGRSIDAEGGILLEADAQGAGGVTPDLRIPLSEETAARIFRDGEDVALETAERLLLGETPAF